MKKIILGLLLYVFCITSNATSVELTTTVTGDCNDMVIITRDISSYEVMIISGTITCKVRSKEVIIHNIKIIDIEEPKKVKIKEVYNIR